MVADLHPKLYCIDRLNHAYPLGNQSVAALRDISLDIFKEDFMCLAGPSGSGKSTLLNILGLIEPVQNGQVRFLNHSLNELNEPEKNRIRKYNLGFVFQNFHLFPVLNAEENVDYFLARQKVSPSERKIRVESALEAVGLWEHRMKKPYEMSGGQRQRVAIARAIAKQPDVIIADEPTANLDQGTGRGIMKILKTLNHDEKVTVILASHDPMVLGMARKTVRLKDGQVISILAEDEQSVMQGEH